MNQTTNERLTLENEKLTLENEKLKWEITALKRPWYWQAQNWLAISSILVGAILGTWGEGKLTKYQVTKAEEKVEKIKEEKSELQIHTNDVRETLGEVTSSVKSGKLSLKERAFLSRAENARYFTGLYSYGINRSEYEAIEKYLEDKGYSIVSGMPLDRRTEWLARKSTVFYYDDKSIEKAKEIAKDFETEKGMRFEIRRGAGMGVVEGQEEWMLFIHYIKSG